MGKDMRKELDKLLTENYPLRLVVKTDDGHTFRNFDAEYPILPQRSDQRLVDMVEDLSNRTGLQGDIINNEVGGRTWFEPRRIMHSQGFFSSGAEIGFGKPSRIARFFNKLTNSDGPEKAIAAALNDPTFWEKMNEAKIASIRLNNEVYSFANGQIVKTKAELNRVGETAGAVPIQNFVS